MTPLGQSLCRQIATTGPLSVADYMAQCLLHPEHGYYTTRDPFGAGGDFITAPEISQMFGELIGLALAQCWLDQGQPVPFTLAEVGPGRGTLMADILRATAKVPGFHESMQLCLIEASEKLRHVQAATLCRDDILWVDTVDDLPEQATFLVANEFFDALPIRQFIRCAAGWQERRVGLRDGTLCFGLGDGVPVQALEHRLADTKDGDLVEISPAAMSIAATIGSRVAQHGGVALIIDYGDWRSLGDTFQAIAQHKPVNPLDVPGEADLTAHVDFEAIVSASPSAHTRLTTQGVFLERLGITARANALAARLTGTALEEHIAAHRRLTHPDEMGTVFKAIALFPADQKPPPGLDI